MRLAVTGASGFVGPRLLAQLAQHGHEGYAISRREIRDLPRGWLWLSRREAMECDEFIRMPAPDAIIHLEVKQHVEAPTPKDIVEFQQVNIDGTRNWLDWCARREVKAFVYLSTIKAVGESEVCLDESASSPPQTEYGRSKRAAEALVQAWASSGRRRALILRPAVIYGPGNRGNVFSMLRAIDRGRFFLIGRNENVKSLVSVANATSAIAHLIQRMEIGVAVYNLVDLTSYPVRDIAQMIAAQLRRGRVRSLPLGLALAGAVLGEALRRVSGLSLPLTLSRLKALTETTHFTADRLVGTGFVHRQSTEEGLHELVDWYRRSEAC